jgi:hypothetical protein
MSRGLEDLRVLFYLDAIKPLQFRTHKAIDLTGEMHGAIDKELFFGMKQVC